MSDKAKSLDVNILGRSYKVTCPDEEREALLQAVAYLDQKMGEIKSSGRVASAK
jgi:cell division protein ZapA